MYMNSLVPVFDCLECVKTEREGLVHFIMQMLSTFTWVEKGARDPCMIKRTHFAHAFFVSNTEQ